MKRVEIYWCDLEPRRGREQGTRRPALIVSPDRDNESSSPLVGVIPLTMAKPKNPLHVLAGGAESDLEINSTVLTEHLRFVDRERLSGAAIGAASDAVMVKMEKNLLRLLALRSLP